MALDNTSRGDSYDRSAYPAGWDEGINEVLAENKKQRESQSIIDAFEEDWTQAESDYKIALASGAPPEVAQSSFITPKLAKWQAFAPVMRNMTSSREGNPFSIFSTGGGELTRVNKQTGLPEIIKEGRPAITRPDAFETVVEETEAVKGKPAYSGFMGTGLGARPAVAGTPKKTVTRKNPINRPAESFDDEFDSGPQAPTVAQQPSRPSFGFIGGAEGFDEGVPFGDNSFEMEYPSRSVPVSAPEPSRRKKGHIYQTPKGPMKWTGTGWIGAK